MKTKNKIINPFEDQKFFNRNRTAKSTIEDTTVSPHVGMMNDQYWENRQQDNEVRKLPIQDAKSITPKPLKWIYNNWLPQGELVVLAGAPGTAKTSFACALAAGITNSKECQLHPNLKANGNGHVLFVNIEDCLEHSLLQKLVAAGADMNFVKFLDNRTIVGNQEPFSFSNDHDLDRLVYLSKSLNNNIGLIVIDPIYLAVDGDHSNNHKARDACQRLSLLANRLDCTVLGIAHVVRNPSGKEPLARVSGACAYREVPRGVILLTKIESGVNANGATHVIVHAKNSLGRIDGGFEYRLEEFEFADQGDNNTESIKAVKFSITAEIFGSAEEILAEAERPKPTESVTKTKIAEEFLLDVLKDGPKLVVEIEALAKCAHIAMGTLKLAKTNLKIESDKKTGAGRWAWSLPSETNDDILVAAVSDQ